MLAIRIRWIARREQQRWSRRGMPLPTELLALIAQGRWPIGEKGVYNLRPLVKGESAKRVFRITDELHFSNAPLATVAEADEREVRVYGGSSFWKSEWAAPAELDWARAIDIGDLGIGSDSPIVLDYRDCPPQPSVRYLRVTWLSETERVFENHWEKVADSFGDFLRMLDVKV